MKAEFIQGALDMEQPNRSEHKEVIKHYFKSLSILLEEKSQKREKKKKRRLALDTFLD